MFTIKGKHYYNDYTSSDFTKSFNTLAEIFEWLASVSENFTNKHNNYFPRFTGGDVSRISADDTHNRGYQYWIYQINNENGIVFSTGIYTAGKSFCAQTVRQWCLDCNKRIKEIREMPNFVEC